MNRPSNKFNSKILRGVFTDVSAYGLLLGGLFGGLYGTILAPLIGTMLGGLVGSIIGLFSGMCAGLVVIVILSIHSNRHRLPSYQIICIITAMLMTFLFGTVSFFLVTYSALHFNKSTLATVLFIVIPSLGATLISGLVTGKVLYNFD